MQTLNAAMLAPVSSGLPGLFSSSFSAKAERTALRIYPVTAERRFIATVDVHRLLDSSAQPSLQDPAYRHAELLLRQIPASDRADLSAELTARTSGPAAAFADALAAGDIDLAESGVAYDRDHARLSEARSRVIVIIDAIAGRRDRREALADAYQQLGEIDTLRAAKVEALDAFRREIALAPLSGRALLSGGYDALALGNVEEARSDFRRAIAADPASASGHVGLARVAMHEAKDPRSELRAAEMLAPTQPDVLGLARDLAANGRYLHLRAVP